jgi:hypothetical protein
MPSDNVPSQVDNTANLFPSFLKEVNFYKKNYPEKQTVGNGSSSIGTTPVSTDTEEQKYILFNDKITGQGYNMSSLLSLEIKESIFTPYMSGTLELFDEYNLIEVVNFTGNETIEIVFSLQNLENEIRLKFKVISAKVITDLSTEERINFLEPARVYELEFISEEVFNHTFTDALLKDEKDFIGYIALSEENKENSEIKGLVNEISRQLDLTPIEIEETKNGIWLKQNEISYPTGKDHGQYPFINLMQQISSYSVSKENPNAVNYFFWKDREGWKFKSLNNLIKAGKEKVKFTELAEVVNSFLGDTFIKSDLIQTYILETDDNKNPYKVWNAVALNQLDSMKLFGQKAYSSYYKSTFPDFSNPYSNFLDTSVGFTYSIIDYDYHRDFEKVEHVEQYKLISEDIETSPLIIKNSKSLSRRNKTVSEKLTIPSFRYGEDAVYGFYDNLRYNTPYGQWIYNSSDVGFGKKVEDPAVVWWDYLGRSGDSRWSNVIWQPQFDMTTLDVKTLHKINKKIREPLREKRKKFANLKNIKRKWEVYRCAVCCLEGANIGGTADAELIKQYQGLSGPTFDILFGATGIFSDLKQEYKVVAAGSFTDTLNYDSGDTGSEYGLTLSYDLTKEPYNQTIGKFYNFKSDLSNYVKYVFDRGLNLYNIAIERTQERLTNLDNFINNADNYISSVDNWITQHLIPCEEKSPTSSNSYYPGFGNVNYGNRPVTSGQNISCGNNADYSNFYTPYVNGGKIPNLTVPEGLCWKNAQFSCPNYPNYEPLPEFAKICSQDIVSSPIQVLNNYITYIDGYYYRYYNLYLNYYDFQYPWQTNSYYEANHEPGELKRCIDSGDCYKTVCFNPIALEVQKRVAVNERKALFVQLELLKYSKDLISNTQFPKWLNQYTEWHNREAFFFSKQPGTSIFTGITGGRTGPIQQPKSLYNVKSIKRKEIRGSRYEILARSKGLTGSQVGEWVYDIFFGNDPNVTSLIKHPYYGQGYSDKNGKGSFVTQRNPHYVYSYEDANSLNNPPWTSQYAEEAKDPSEFTERIFTSYPPNVVDGVDGFTKKQLVLDDLNSLIGFTDEGFRETFNIFEDDLTNKKPPNIKKEEIASYVRIEFESPIGLDRIADFPNGFVRDAGTEYFLPYLVQITPGPNGRQTIRNNIAVIGMDPYGFDVAIKKSKISDEQENKSRAYWWWDSGTSLLNTSLSENSMDLWPEIGFETSRPYYTADPKNTWNSIGEVSDYYGYSNYSNFWDYTTNSNYWGVGIDPEYKQSAQGSNFINTSHKRIKPHRSWWSFHFPKNVFVPHRLFGLFNSVYGPWYEGFYSGDYFVYGYWNYQWWYGEEVDRWLRLADTPDTRELLSQAEMDKIILPKSEDGFVETMNVHIPTSIDDMHPDLKKYFTQSALHWFNADYNIYRPGLISSDVWKYDLSGETEYGLISPPTIEPNYDIFDNNFAAQFVVYGRSTSICQQFTCANPKGKISNKQCPESNPYCNCPAQEHMPDEKEPTYLELYQLYNELKECDLIQEHLGEDYLGCVWIDPNNPCSCNCPEIGKKFAEYLEYTRTYATYWDTPKNTPLLRNALMSQFLSQQVTIGIIPNDNIKIGDMIKLVHTKLITSEEEGAYKDDNPSKRFNGYWIVSEIRHKFTKESVQTMQLILNRDTIPRKPN